MIVNTFTMPLDASLFNFKWSDAQNITVKYGTSYQKGKISVVVSEVGLGFSLLWELNNMPELKRQIEEAAAHNAETYWREQKQKPAIDLSNINEHLRPAFAGLI